MRDDTLAGGGLAAVDLAAGAVQTSEVGNSQVRSADVRDDTITGGGLTASDLAADAVGNSEVANGSLGGLDVTDESLSGSDINESSLSTVPRAGVAALGGIGRWTGGGSCDPENENYVDCAIVTLNLPAPARVLLIGEVSAWAEADADSRSGYCELVSNAGRIVPNSQIVIGFERIRLAERRSYRRDWSPDGGEPRLRGRLQPELRLGDLLPRRRDQRGRPIGRLSCERTARLLSTRPRPLPQRPARAVNS